MKAVFREITPLSNKDCFMIFFRKRSKFTFPIHTHAECELNFIENAGGTKRIVGDSVEEIDDLELTLIVNPDLQHAWLNPNTPPKDKEIIEITIQFHRDLLNDQLLQKNQLCPLREMLQRASNGLTFSRRAIEQIKDRLYSLSFEREGAHSVFKLFGILYDLSLDTSMRELSSPRAENDAKIYKSRRIEKVYNYMLENYSRKISLSEVAELVGMTEVSFSRFFKKRTSRSFIDSLNEIRLGYATRMLIDTTTSIAEICFSCGFNNISNFNRIFKKKKGCTPKEFRENYTESRIFL